MAKIRKLFNVFNSAEFNAFVDRQAEDFNRLKPYRDEMKSGFLVFSVLGVIASLVSMASAWQYFTRLLEVLISNVYVLKGSITVLLLSIELATLWLIYKSIKFILHYPTQKGNMIYWAVGFFLCALGMSGFNFHTSTNGLKQKSREAVSQHSELLKVYSMDSLMLEARLVPEIDSLTVANSKLAQKTTLQNTTMFAANAETIKTLREELKAERKSLKLRLEADLANDAVRADSKSGFYWKLVVVFQLILYVSHIFTAFYLHKTDEQSKSTETRIAEFASTMRDKTMDAVSEMVNGTIGSFLTSLLSEAEREVRLQNPVDFEAVDTTTETSDTDLPATPTSPQVIGFAMQRTDATADATTRDHQDVLVDSKNVQFEKTDATTITDQIKRIEKHATLVRHIIKLTEPSDGAISNSTIEEIQTEAAQAQYKGRTLIRELFEIIKAVGREKVEELVCK